MNTIETLNIKKVGIILRPSTPELKEMFFKTKTIFEQYDIEVLVDNISGSMIDVLGQEFEIMCENSDILVTIGGDGTLISTVRRSYQFNIPVLGLHAGRLGFLADIDIGELDEFVQLLLNKEFRIDQRHMLEATITTAKGEQKVIAFNDIVLTRPTISKMIHLKMYVDNKKFNTYYGDGVIVSTPTGSTAYNLSSGGPVIFPLPEVFVLTPISPHSLTQRPVVLPSHFAVEVKTPDPKALAIVDGQEIYTFSKGDSIKIHLSTVSAQLVHRKEFNYFDVLREKLNWGD